MVTFGETPWYERQDASNPYYLGSVLGQIKQLRDGRRQRRAQEMQRELSSFYQLAQKYPEVAGTWGKDLLSKYGEQAPDLKAFLAAIEQRDARRQEIDSAGKAWLSKADQAFAENRSRQALGMASALRGAFNMDPGQATLGAQHYQEAATAPASQPLREAAAAMPPSRAAAAAVWAKEHGFPFPEPYYPRPFDRSKDLPQNLRVLEAIRQGIIPPDTPAAQAAQYANELEMSPVDRERLEFQKLQEERKARETALRERQQARREERGGEEAEEERRSALTSFKSYAKASVEDIVVETERKMKELPQDRLTGEEKKSLSSRGITRIDPKRRYKPLKGHLDAIAEEANRAYLAGELSYGEAQKAIEAAAREYANLVVGGMLPQKAFQRVRAGR